MFESVGRPREQESPEWTVDEVEEREDSQGTGGLGAGGG